MHDLREAYRRVYEAIGTREIDLLMPPPQQPMPQDPALENARSLKMEMLQVFPDQDHDAHISAHGAFIQSRMIQINPMVYALLQGHISDHISFKAQGEIGAMISESEEMSAMAQQDPAGFEIQFNSMVAKRIAELTAQLVQAEGGSQQQDPLVALKQRELDLKAMDIQRRAQEAQQDMDRKEMELEEKYDLERLKVENQEEQAAERMKVAQDKLKLQEQSLRAKSNEPKKKG